MENWKKFIESEDFNELKLSSERSDLKDNYGVYPNSINITKKCSCFIALDEDKKVLVVIDGSEFDSFEGDEVTVAQKSVKVCALSNYNSNIIRKVFDFTNPKSAKDESMSLGLGDRLGIASAGHLKLLEGKDIFPILAQQSIRELNLTNRTYEDVLASAVWAILQEGYKDGYGADGDHLKTEDEVEMALNCGFTMITLDCSEHIDNEIEGLSSDIIQNEFSNLDSNKREYWENKYLNKKFELGFGKSLTILKDELSKTILTYSKAIEFAVKIYNDILKNYDRQIDYEISIDETLTSTSLEAHFIIASELKDYGVQILNMAPRFCGEFQKGIDYRGDVKEFEKEFEMHCAIAQCFGYKISVHSGSDKFSIFPIVGDKTNKRFHVKTAGTNWLEAIRVVAENDPELFKKIYRFAIKRLPDAKKFYHIFTEAQMVPDIAHYSDGELCKLMDIEEARQALHVTYGYILCEKGDDGKYLLKDDFVKTMHKYEDEYYDALKNHIGHHLDCLGV